MLDKVLVGGSVGHTIKRQDDGVTGVRHCTVFSLQTSKERRSHSKYKLEFKYSYGYLQFMVLLLRTLIFALANTVKSVSFCRTLSYCTVIDFKGWQCVIL